MNVATREVLELSRSGGGGGWMSRCNAAKAEACSRESLCGGRRRPKFWADNAFNTDTSPSHPAITQSPHALVLASHLGGHTGSQHGVKQEERPHGLSSRHPHGCCSGMFASGLRDNSRRMPPDIF